MNLWQIKKKELLKPKCDIVFQALFAENKYNITQSLISDILGEKVEIIDIKTDSTIARKYPTDKGGRLDLRTKFKDGTICQVEMQMAEDKDICPVKSKIIAPDSVIIQYKPSLCFPILI